MKKIILMIIVFFSFVNYINAKTDIVIDNMIINNGEISPKFDKYNNYYSVKVDKNVKELDINYEYNENKYDVKIGNNEDIVNNKLVYVTVFDKKSLEQNTYILKIFNEESEKNVTNIVDEDVVDINIKEKKYDYAPLIGTICLASILVVFKIFFL